jgi:hypothetical protein
LKIKALPEFIFRYCVLMEIYLYLECKIFKGVMMDKEQKELELKKIEIERAISR